MVTVTRAPLSLCLIYRDDPLLEQAIASVRPYVAQIAIVVDDDAPAGAIATAYRLGDVVRQHPWTDDFAASRNISLSLATEPWAAWMDSDDVVLNAEHLAREIATASKTHPGGRLLAAYEYGFSKEGECTLQQWRERIVPNDGSWVWEHPTHESLVKKNGFKIDPGTDYWMRDVRWVHKRTETGARSRSLNILRKWHAAGHDDAWTHLQLGLELHAAHEYAEALEHYARHVELSGWEEERAMSCLRAADCALALDLAGKEDEYDKAASWIQRALEIRPNDFEPLYAQAKLAMLQANFLGREGAMADVVGCCREALQTPETRTPLGRNPQDRAFNVHDLMRTAAEAEQDWATALEATERALEARPDSPPLLLARKRYSAAKLVASFGPREETKTSWSDATGNLHEPGPKPSQRGRGASAHIPPADGPGEPASTHRPLLRDVLTGELFTVEDRCFLRPATEAAALKLTPALLEEIDREILKDSDAPWEFVGVTMPPPRQPLDIVFLCGPAADPWNPELVERYGHGGSETAVVEMAKRLAKLGHKVRVFCNPGLEGTFDGVDYEMWTPEVKPECDVAVVWRMAQLLPQAKAKAVVAWPHDTEMLSMTYGYSLLADKVLALSEWHKSNLIAKHGIPESQVFVTRNGIDPKLYEGAAFRNPRKALYCSSPDRGLGALLDMWPEIHERVPDATLDVFYSFAAWERQANERKDEQHRFLCATLKRRMRALGPLGVLYHGKVNRTILASFMRTSGALLMPNWFQETSCMACLEARAAGMRIVATPVAALNESVGDWGTLVEGDWVSDEFQAKFVEASVRALTVDYGHTRETISSQAIRTLGWDGVAESWCKLFDELMAAAKHGALPEYREWREVAA